MNETQLPIFKELAPYSGQIDQKNRWIRLAKLVPWEEMNRLYKNHFDESKQSVIKTCQLIIGLFLGQMILKLSDREIVDYFHENPYFQYFCRQDTFVCKTEKGIIHPSLLSKRRKRLGKSYVQQFEKQVLEVLKQKGVIKGHRLMLDATVFPAHIAYPNDVKLLNSVRDYLCNTILVVKNGLNVSEKIRTYRRVGRKLFLNFQKKRERQFRSSIAHENK